MQKSVGFFCQLVVLYYLNLTSVTEQTELSLTQWHHTLLSK